MARLAVQTQGQSGLTLTLTRVSDSTAVQLYSDVAQTNAVSQPVSLDSSPKHYYFTAPATTAITAKLLNGSTTVNSLSEQISNEDQMVLTPYVPPPVVSSTIYQPPLAVGLASAMPSSGTGSKAQYYQTDTGRTYTDLTNGGPYTLTSGVTAGQAIGYAIVFGG